MTSNAQPTQAAPNVRKSRKRPQKQKSHPFTLSNISTAIGISVTVIGGLIAFGSHLYQVSQHEDAIAELKQQLGSIPPDAQQALEALRSVNGVRQAMTSYLEYRALQMIDETSLSNPSPKQLNRIMHLAELSTQLEALYYPATADTPTPIIYGILEK